MNAEVLVEQIEGLVAKAAAADKSDDALKFSQAACNAANTMAQIQHVEHDSKIQ